MFSNPILYQATPMISIILQLCIYIYDISLQTWNSLKPENDRKQTMELQVPFWNCSSIYTYNIYIHIYTYIYILAGGLEQYFYFSHRIGNIIIPTVTHSIIFQRGRSTTNQYFIHIYIYTPSGYLTQTWKPWPIEIDDFPSERNLHLWLGIFHGELLVITRGYPFHSPYHQAVVNVPFVDVPPTSI